MQTKAIKQTHQVYHKSVAEFLVKGSGLAEFLDVKNIKHGRCHEIHMCM